jgi:Colicin V production protein
MTIWILAILLLALLGFIGYSMGAIRMGFSIFGLIISACLAGPAAKTVAGMVKGLLGAFSVHNPVLIWAISPLVAFTVMLILFAIAAEAVHRQVEVFYKYKAGDLRYSLWERMNKRVGACLGTINALIYLVLISFVIYVVGYATTQMAVNESGPKLVQYVNRASRDVVATGLVKAVRAIDPVPQSYYQASDIIGMVYHNPLTEGRLSRYPTFLGLAERPEFQDLANDTSYLEMLERQAPVSEILQNDKTKHILDNPDLLKDIWGLIGPDLGDLSTYLQTGESAKYGSQKILGRWTFSPASSIVLLKQKKPNISSTELQRLKKYLVVAYGKATFVATPDKQALLKNVVWVKPGQVIKKDMMDNPTKLTGSWAESGDGYSVSLNEMKDLTVDLKNGKLEMTGEWAPLVFTPDE